MKKLTEKKPVKKVKDTATKAANIAAGRVFKYSQFSEPADSRIQVKMPESFRHFVVLAARTEKKSLSYVIIELLREKYGEPKKTKKIAAKKVEQPKLPDIDGLFGSEITEL
jgi:hypothetical protein